MTSAFRTIGLAAFIAAAPGTAWAGVTLSGSYQADGLGRVALRVEGERVVVQATEPGACDLANGSPVVEGEFQGNVLVGKLTVIAFVLGVGFSGMLMMTARSRRLAELSVPRVAARGGAPRPLLEASGGVSLETVQAIARSGVDLISVGALTNSAPVLDVGLDVAPVTESR